MTSTTPGVWRHDERAQPRVGRRRIALDDDRATDVGRRELDGREQLQRILESLQRRQEDEDVTVALLDSKRSRERILDRDLDGRRPGQQRHRGRKRRQLLEGRTLTDSRRRLPGDGAERQPQTQR